MSQVEDERDKWNAHNSSSDGGSVHSDGSRNKIPPPDTADQADEKKKEEPEASDNEKGSAKGSEKGSDKEDEPSKLSAYITKLKESREAQKEDSAGKKACVGIGAIFALIYSLAVMTLFHLEIETALERKRDWTYACSYYGTRDGDASRISEWWLTAMLYSYYCFAILSVGALMTIVGAWWIPARNTAAAVVAGGMVFHIVMIIWLAIVRFSEGG